MNDQRCEFVPPRRVAHDPASAPARASQRDSLLISATLRRAGRADGVLRVRNLSGGGLMADFLDDIAVGEGVEVELRGIGAVAARVAWVRKGRIGLGFLREINPRLVRTSAARGAMPEFEPVRPSLQGRRPGLKPR